MRCFYVGVSALCLSACASGASDYLGPINPLGTTLEDSADTVSILNDNLDVTLPTDAEYASGSFVAGASINDGPPIQILAFSETDDTFAAILRNLDNGTSADVFVGRTTDIGGLPDGTATLEGTYKGTLTEADETTLAMLITGDVSLDIDFAEMTLSGDITIRTTSIADFRDSQGVPIEFHLSSDLRLQNGTLSNDGTFRGDVISFETEDDVETILSDNGTFDGLLGGENASEGVGRIFVPNEIEQDDSTAPFSDEIGVFAVGH